MSERHATYQHARAMHAMLDYDFMRNAFAAGGIVAVVAGVVGYFLVLRGQAFAGHALSHVGFAGRDRDACWSGSRRFGVCSG